MATKPFIHPEVLLRIKANLNNDGSDTLDKQELIDAKGYGEEYANKILSTLFSANEEFGVIESHFNTERLSSNKYKNLRQKIISIHYQRVKLNGELKKLEPKLNKINRSLSSSKRSLFKFLLKKRIARLSNESEHMSLQKNNLGQALSESYIDLKYQYEQDGIKEAYSDLSSAFNSLRMSIKIWDITTKQLNLETKAAAGTSIERKEVIFKLSGLDYIQTAEPVMCMGNANGGDLYFYPNFVIVYKNDEDLGIIDYSELELDFQQSRFLEEKASIPSDTKILGETWYRVNKDGSPDRRFINNYQIPIVQYGQLHFKSNTGVNDGYHVSNYEKANLFNTIFKKYQILLKQVKFEV